MKEIQLTRGMVALVDDEDYEYLNKWHWYVYKGYSTFYALSKIKHKDLKMHRIIMNCPKDMQVDHKDGNGLNNQKGNLRICTNAQNQANRKSYGKSKYLGVSYNRNTYIQAYIGHNKRNIYLGVFKTEEEAAIAYNEAAIKLHGEFAKLNII